MASTGAFGSITIPVNYQVNTSNLTSGLNNALGTLNRSTSKITNMLSNIGKVAVAAFSVKSIVGFGKACVEIGSNLSEVQNVVDTVFGKSAESIGEFAKNAVTQFGLSELSAKKYVSTLGSIVKASGFTAESMETMSKSFTGLAGDIASFYNVSSDEAFNALKSGLTGETEPLKKYGIVLTQANLQQYALSQGITTAVNKMSEQEKMLLRYNYIMDVTKDAQGDFAKTSDSWANQTRILSEQFNTFKGILGTFIIEALTPIIRVLNEFMSTLNRAASSIQSFFGIEIKSSVGTKDSANITENATSANVDLAKSYDTVGDAAKKATTSLAKFDNVNQLSSSSGSSKKKGSGGAVDIKPINTKGADSTIDKVKKKILDIPNIFKDAFNSLGLADNFKSVVSNLKDIFDGIKPSAKGFFSAYIKSIKSGAKGLASVLSGVVKGLIGGIDKWLTQGKDRITTNISSIFDNMGRYYTAIGKITEKVGKLLGDFFSLESTQQAVADCLSIIEGYILGTKRFITGLYADIAEGFLQILSDNESGLSEALSNFSQIIQGTTDIIKTVVFDCFESVQSAYDNYVKPAISNFTDGLSNAFKTVLDLYNTYIAPTIQEIQKDVKDLWDTHIKPFVDKIANMVGKFIEMVSVIYKEVVEPIVSLINSTLVPIVTTAISTVWGGVKELIAYIVDTFSGLADILSGIFDVIIGVLTGDMSKLTDGLTEILKGFVNILSSAITAPINFLIGLVNGFIRGLNKIKIPDWVIGIGGKGINIPEISKIEIPKLANGGVVTKGTHFIAGEAGAEAIVPLQNSRYTKSLAHDIASELSTASEKGTNGITVQIENAFGDARSMGRLADSIVELVEQKLARKGYAL